MSGIFLQLGDKVIMGSRYLMHDSDSAKAAMFDPITACLDLLREIETVRSYQFRKGFLTCPVRLRRIRDSRRVATDAQKAGNLFAQCIRTKSFVGTVKNIFCIY